MHSLNTIHTITTMAAKQKPTEKPTTLGLRDRLILVIDRELDGLPELPNGLNGKERLDGILRLLPLIMPKAKPVHNTANEAVSWS